MVIPATNPLDKGSLGSVGFVQGIGNRFTGNVDFARQDYFNRQAQEFNAMEASKSRDFTAEQNELNRSFNAREAALNREWQEKMSNTSYSRAVKDMKSAGLNPALLYSSGGQMSSPSGSSASYGGSGGASASVGAGHAGSSGSGYGDMLKFLSGIVSATAMAFSKGLSANASLERAYIQGDTARDVANIYAKRRRW